MNLTNLVNKNHDLRLRFLILTLSIWFSIGSKVTDVYLLELSFSSLINFLKALFTILFPVLILTKIILNKIYIKFFKSEYLFLILFFLIQFSFTNNENMNELITNVFFPQKILELSKNLKYGLELNSISVLLMALSTIFFLDLYKKEKSLIIALIISLFIYLLLNFFYSLILFNNYFSNANLQSLYYTQQIKYGHFFFDNVTPRSTGISRSLLILSTLLFIFLLFVKKNINKIFISLMILIINSLIILFSSRFSIWILPLIYIFLFLFFIKEKKINYFLILISFLIIPYFVSSSIYNYKIKEFLKIDKTKSLADRGIMGFSNNSSKLNNSLELNKNIINAISEKSSGRINIWKEGLKIYKQNNKKLFGLGHQADRRYLYDLKEVNNFYGSSMSNGFLNALLSSGIVGITFLILFNLFVLKRIYNFIKIDKILNIKPKKNIEDILILSSIVIFLILNTRMMLENSYTVFGVDFLIYITSTFIIINKIKFTKNFS